MLFRKKAEMPRPEDVLPGRDQKLPVAERHFVLNAPLLPPFPEKLELGLFGMGCFWGAERKFWEVSGIYSTSVGYAAGGTSNPSYEEVCSGLTGHNEVVRVVFDPATIAYEGLLKIFWENHDPSQGMQQGNAPGNACINFSAGNITGQHQHRVIGPRGAIRYRPGRCHTDHSATQPLPCNSA